MSLPSRRAVSSNKAAPPRGNPYYLQQKEGLSALFLLCAAVSGEILSERALLAQIRLDLADGHTHLLHRVALAPFKAAILPLSKKEVLTGPAQELYAELSKEFMVDYDETGSIGKRYRREDEIGTPFCITFDFETVGDENTPADHCVTVRERDTMQQVRMPISEVKAYLREKCAF